MNQLFEIADRGIELAKSLKLKKSAEYMIAVLFSFFVILGSRLVHDATASWVTEYAGVGFLVCVLFAWVRYLAVNSGSSDPSLAKPPPGGKAAAARQNGSRGRGSSNTPVKKTGR